MDLFWLATLQGLTEFLPVSSTCHVLLASLFLKGVESNRLLEVVLHGGTLLTLLLYFRSEVTGMIRSFFLFLSKGRVTPSLHLLGLLSLGTLPVVMGGFFLETFAHHWGRGLQTMGIISILVGTLMYLVDRFAPQRKSLPALSGLGILVIGLFQVAALIPGVSRLGSTLIGGRLLGYRRSAAARLSFLLAIPAIMGALTLMVWKLPHKIALVDATLGWSLLIAFVTGIIALSAFMVWMRKRTLAPFAIYRIAFGAFLLWYSWA